MSSGLKFPGLPGSGEAISFGERFVRSDGFDRVFKEGMALVEAVR